MAAQQTGSAPDEVKIKLIFPNAAWHEMTVPLSTKVQEVKKTILEQHLPSSLGDVDQVERLRLFERGRELGGKDAEDAKSLKDTKIMVNNNVATPVHVSLVQKSSEPAAEKETAKPSQCFCALL